MKKSDYQQFTAAAKELGAQMVKKIGWLDGRVFVEAWEFEGPPRVSGEGFILAHNLKDGTIGVYQFVGKSGASVDEDIKWLMKTYVRVSEFRPPGRAFALPLWGAARFCYFRCPFGWPRKDR